MWLLTHAVLGELWCFAAGGNVAPPLDVLRAVPEAAGGRDGLAAADAPPGPVLGPSVADLAAVTPVSFVDPVYVGKWFNAEKHKHKMLTDLRGFQLRYLLQFSSPLMMAHCSPDRSSFSLNNNCLGAFLCT